VTAANGWLVVTAVNLADGSANSETYKIEAVDDCTSPDGPLQRFSVKAADDLGDTRSYVITLHEVGQILPEVRPYRELVQALIAADTPCPAPGCRVTTLGHLLASLTADQVELVRKLDPDAREEP
jgi:hypothetical protein